MPRRPKKKNTPELEAHITEILDFADKLYESVSDKEFIVIEPRQRYEFVMTKYPQFNKAYPVVAKYMVLTGRYDRKSFRKFIDYLGENRVDNLWRFCEIHAEYVRILYLEDCKRDKKHPDLKYAAKVKEAEFKNMYRVMKNIKRIEKEETATYNNDQDELLKFKREELLAFINAMAPPQAEKTYDDMNSSELSSVLYILQEREQKLMQILEQKNKLIHQLESQRRDWVPSHLLKY